MRFEASFVELTEVCFSKSKKGLTILQLSDIHMKFLKVSATKTKEIIDKQNPDIIIMSGDYIETANDVKNFLNFISVIKGRRPIYLCLGNHDYGAFDRNPEGLQNLMSQIEKLGVNVIHNKSVCIEKNNKKYNIIGLADFRSNKHDIAKALASKCKDADINIAFSHNPDIVFELPKGEVDYLFSGHFHGGQIWTPFGLEFKLLRDERLCKMGIKRGLHKVNGVNLYINRGLGNVVFPLRFLSRPEITVFHMP